MRNGNQKGNDVFGWMYSRTRRTDGQESNVQVMENIDRTNVEVR